MSAQIDHFGHKVHVLLKREDLDHERLQGKVAIVLDVLFATTTIIHALESGAQSVIPTIDETSARRAAAQLEKEVILAGELYAETLPGFAHPAPLELAKEKLSKKDVIYSTTNGTVALNQARGVDEIFVGALINAEAVVEHVIQSYPEKTILIVCSGSMGNPNLEDTCGAGYFVDLIHKKLGHQSDGFYSDTACMAKAIFKSEPSEALLLKSRVGRMMISRQMEHEVQFAAQLSSHGSVPIYRNDVITVI